MKIINYSLLASFLLLFSLCRNANAQKLNTGDIRLMIDTATALKQSFTGFVLYDPKKDEMLFENYPDKYFTPASNTKLYTFYSATKILGDSIPTLGYKIQGDSLIFWATGYPLLLHPDFNDSTALNFLASRTEKLFYYDRPSTDERFGPGWSWDDYTSYYSSEKSKFPIYGNHINFRFKGSLDSLLVFPEEFKENIIVKEGKAPSEFWPLYREEFENTYYYYPEADTFKSGRDVKMPFMYSENLFIDLLENAIHKKIKKFESDEILHGSLLQTAETDTLYRKMLRESDNFLAEQIMMMCSSELSDTIGIDLGIDWVKENFMQDFPDEPIWVDGSGLSRYNMFTPRTTVRLLTELLKTAGKEKLFDFLPAGGYTGTIENWYKGKNGPYVYAKTGTLSNNHCLSGYVLTKKKKTLIFSFMLNHYIVYTSRTKKVMQQVLEYIYENY